MTSPADSIVTLQARFPGASLRASGDHPAVTVAPGDVVAVLKHLQEEQGFDMLVDITAIDWAEDVSPRFTVVWHLLAIARGEYLRVAADCLSDAEPTMPTATGLWPAADWHERETFDLLGITFTGHPDLRRILMWDGYPYHPLRKDFPLAGIEVPLPDLEVAEVTGAKVKAAPMAGGPFVASTGEMNLTEAEPRAKDESWNERVEKPE